jgi:predicted enzyme related to lactoylglutathione lyase
MTYATDFLSPCRGVRLLAVSWVEDLMDHPFVWFHNGSDKPSDAVPFYEALLGWKSSDGPGMTLLASENGPFAGIGPREGGASGWIPYAQVEDVDASTDKAVKLGASVLQPKTRGPAGEFCIVRDPGGAAIALWQKA